MSGPGQTTTRAPEETRTPPSGTPGAERGAGAAAFNYFAAANVYRQAGTLQLDRGAARTGFVNVDATIKGSSIETNLAALEAGSNDPRMRRFAGIVRQHPELMQGLDAMLKDEGRNVIDGVQRMLNGPGTAGFDMDRFEEMMRDPTKRKMMAQMFRRVGSPQAGMEYAERFVGAAVAAAQDPMANGNRFLEVAREGGIDTNAVQNQAMMGAFRDLLRNPEQGVNRLLRQMESSFAGMPGPMGNILAGLISLVGDNAGNLANLFQDIVRPYMELGEFYGARVAARGETRRAQAAGQLTPSVGTPLPGRGPGGVGHADAPKPQQQQLAAAIETPDANNDNGGQLVGNNKPIGERGAVRLAFAAAHDGAIEGKKPGAGPLPDMRIAAAPSVA